MFGSSMASFNSAEPRPTSRPAPPRGPPVPNASSAAADPLRSKLGPGRTEVGYVATRASAKMNEYKGYCLALVVHGRLVRPCKPLRFGDAAPFWSEADVEGLEVGMPVQLTAAAASSGSSYPHAFEDVEVEGGTLTPMPRAKRKSLGELLPQMCQPSLETVWPADVWNDRSDSGGSNSVRDGSHVPSLTVVKGEVVRYGTPEKPDKQRAQIVTECGIKLCAKVRVAPRQGGGAHPVAVGAWRASSLRCILGNRAGGTSAHTRTGAGRNKPRVRPACVMASLPVPLGVLKSSTTRHRFPFGCPPSPFPPTPHPFARLR